MLLLRQTSISCVFTTGGKYWAELSTIHVYNIQIASFGSMQLVSPRVIVDDHRRYCATAGKVRDSNVWGFMYVGFMTLTSIKTLTKIRRPGPQTWNNWTNRLSLQTKASRCIIKLTHRNRKVPGTLRRDSPFPRWIQKHKTHCVNRIILIKNLWVCVIVKASIGFIFLTGAPLVK